MAWQQRRLPALLLVAAAAAVACTESPTTPVTGAAPPAVRTSSLATPAGYVRIGVVPSATSVLIGATGPFTVRDKATGALLATGAGTQIRVELVPGTINTLYRLQVVCTPTVSDRDSRLATLQGKGYVTYTEWYQTKTCWRVMIGEFAYAGTYAQRVAFKNQAVAAGNAPSDAFWQAVTTGTTPQLRVINGATVLVNTNPVVVTPETGLLLINGVQYRGTGEVGFNSGLQLAGINELPLEQYLYGVVPAELPPTTYPELEALKAQAVAARTYTLAGMGKRAADGYDLLATVSDQVYYGTAREKPLSTQAVDETAGMVLTYEGKLISAMYHSTSGGWTANNEDVYVNASPVPYLRGIPDAQRGEALEHVPSPDVFRNHANARSLRAAHEGDFESDWARWHRWTFEWSAAEISEILSLTYGPVGQVRAINVLDRSESGRVGTIEFVTGNGTFSAQKDGIRAVLKYYDASHVATNLPSTLFYIDAVLDHKTGEVTGFKAWGGGIGHGLGLAQTGAVGMAQKRATYQEILTHYYRGVSLEQR